jgi:hypothetical protein
MTSVLLVVIAAVTAGYLAGGRLTRLAQSGVRLTGLAAVGLVFQFAPVDGLGAALPRVLLWLSFALLVVFSAVNLRRAGFPLFLLGVLLNLTVIALNDGMAISADALVASGDRGQIAQLQDGIGGAKYHLADSDDRLLPLTDVIVLPPPVGEVVSIGDLFVDAGLAWFLFSAMGPGTRRRSRSSGPIGMSRTTRRPYP